ncbi:hypothetical protein ANCDUO_00942 [Ancylostoma duodenale]|uniref:Beta-galactosidase galactose-binding domain-containing protein n=1 Tax=Ancylostoma duodenale TaxID=51022 RepID=A0A0C2H4I0_9BILA|nr:hypothetical protein ANCDUO_00942 [Ancylostoma duodenale]
MDLCGKSLKVKQLKDFGYVYMNKKHLGILSDVELDKNVLHGWTQCKLDITNDYADISSSNAQGAGKHGVYHGIFNVDVPTDTFINTTGWGKGVAVINGNNIGRYWASEGPQMTLYVPAAFLQPGENFLLVLELEGTTNCSESTCSLSLVDRPIYVWSS